MEKLLFIEIHKFKKKIVKNIKMRSMKNQMPKEQVMNEMETILFLLFLNVSKNAPSQLKATLDPRGAPLESQIHQHTANEPLIQ